MTPDTISVTTLIRPPQQVALIERHKNELPPEDVMDKTWRVMGSENQTARRVKDRRAAETDMTCETKGWLDGAFTRLTW